METFILVLIKLKLTCKNLSLSQKKRYKLAHITLVIHHSFIKFQTMKTTINTPLNVSYDTGINKLQTTAIANMLISESLKKITINSTEIQIFDCLLSALQKKITLTNNQVEKIVNEFNIPKTLSSEENDLFQYISSTIEVVLDIIKKCDNFNDFIELIVKIVLDKSLGKKLTKKNKKTEQIKPMEAAVVEKKPKKSRAKKRPIEEFRPVTPIQDEEPQASTSKKAKKSRSIKKNKIEKEATVTNDDIFLECIPKNSECKHDWMVYNIQLAKADEAASTRKHCTKCKALEYL